MAIDPSISLAVRPPVIQPLQIQSPLEQFAKVLSLRNLMTENQSGQIGLQAQQMKMQEAQRDIQERQAFADYLHAHLTGGAPATAAPVQTPAIAPQMPASGFTGGEESVPGLPNVGALPAPRLGSLMAAPPASAALQPVAQQPALGGQDESSPYGRLNLGEIVSRFPTHGLAFAKNVTEQMKAEAEAKIKQHDAAMGVADELGRAGRAVRDSTDPAAQFKTELTDLGTRGILQWPVVRQMISDGYEAHKNDIASFIAKAQNGKDSSEIAKTNLQAAQEEQKKVAVLMRGVRDQAGYDKLLPNLSPELRAFLGPAFSPELKSVVRNWDVGSAELPGMVSKQIALAGQTLEPARARGQAAYDAELAKYPKEVQDVYALAATPKEVRNLALTEEQKTTAAQAAGGTELTELEVGGKPHKVLVNKGTGEVVKDLGVSGFKPQQVNVNANASLLDRESARFAKPHEKAVTDANTQLEKINEARSLINGPATAQALGIPKVLSALVGGPGSGLRMTKAELDAIAKARGISGDVEGFIRKVSGGGTLTAQQQKDLTGLLDDVATRIVQKQSIANDALDRINSAGSREEIVKIDSETRRKLGAGGAKTYSQADVDAAVAAHPGLTAAQADAAFAAKGWKKK